MLLRSSAGRLPSQLAQVLRRIDGLETKLAQVSQRVDWLKTKFAVASQGIDRLETILGNLATTVAQWADRQPQFYPADVENDGKEEKLLWKKDNDGHWIGELRVGQRVLRKVKPIAKNVIGILDAGPPR
jgi:hypothetical protein